MTESFKPVRGGTLYGQIGGSKSHLFVLCNDPIYYPRLNVDAVLSVNITSWTGLEQHDDSTCIINVGDHPFIKHKSFVFYGGAWITGAQTIIKNVQESNYEPMGQLDESVLQRILKGFEVSRKPSREVSRFYKYLMSLPRIKPEVEAQWEAEREETLHSKGYTDVKDIIRDLGLQEDK